MPFIHLDDLKDIEIEQLPGFKIKLVNTEYMSFTYMDIKAGSSFPVEQHPNEQVMTMLEGEFELTIGDEVKVCKPGDVGVIPPDIPHTGRAITDCRTIEAFYPRSRKAGSE